MKENFSYQPPPNSSYSHSDHLLKLKLKEISFTKLSIFPSIINQLFAHYWVSLMAQTVKNLPAKQETWV